MHLEPVTLVGRTVRLEPLSMAHLPALARVGLEPELWRLQPAPIESAEDMRDYVASALEEQRRGRQVARGPHPHRCDRGRRIPQASDRDFELSAHERISP
jgi:hypothetical protein